MPPPTIQALGVTQEWAGTRGKATGDVEGVGWLAAWGPSLVAARRVAEAAEAVEDQDEAS